MSFLDQIIEPTFVVSESICRRNIEAMADKARRLGMNLRPHFKTHQLHEVGRWFRDYGINTITASSVRMAEYFAQDGWDDITVAFPVNIRETDRIRALSERVKVNLLVENREGIAALEKGLTRPADIWIKMDCGTHRTGFTADQFDQVDELVEILAKSPKLRFQGFLTHAGHSYKARSREELAAVHAGTMDVIRKFRGRYDTLVPNLQMTYGDTPTCFTMDAFPGVNELRPGNFIYFDWMQWQISTCTPEEIGGVAACPVVAKHPERNIAIIYGGAVHFSKDFIENDRGERVFGKVGAWTENGWTLSPDGPELIAISQEHGQVRTTPEALARMQIGDLLPIAPVHSCLTQDLLRGNTVIV